MESLKVIIEEKYSILLKEGFEFQNVQEKPERFASASLYNPVHKTFIHFMKEYDSLSILLQGEYASKKSDSYQLLIIEKYLYPEIPYQKLKHNDIDFLKKNLTKIYELFSEENSDNITKALNKEKIAYSKFWWKSL